MLSIEDVDALRDRMTDSPTIDGEIRALCDEIYRLRAVIDRAEQDLCDDHQPLMHGAHAIGCQICYPADGSWPCVVRLTLDDLTAATPGEIRREDFYRDHANGDLVYRWSDERMVLMSSDCARAVRYLFGPRPDRYVALGPTVISQPTRSWNRGETCISPRCMSADECASHGCSLPTAETP